MQHKYGFLLLAAGSSSRLGRSKALLPYRGTTLIEHVIGEMKRAGFMPIIVVTGAGRELLETRISTFPDITLAHNSGWQEGMASSIRTGLERITNMQKGLHGIIVTVCDQPFVSAELFWRMVERKEAGDKNIIACAYSDTLGAPVLFDRCYFQELLQLQGAGGAKELLQLHADDVACIAFAKGTIDIDTPQDYIDLVKE